MSVPPVNGPKFNELQPPLHGNRSMPPGAGGDAGCVAVVCSISFITISKPVQSPPPFTDVDPAGTDDGIYVISPTIGSQWATIGRVYPRRTTLPSMNWSAA